MIVLVAVATLVSAAGCQVSRVGRRCAPDSVGQDTTHVLICKRGRFVRWMSKADALRLLAAVQAQNAAGTPAAAPPAARATVPPVAAGTTPPAAGSGWGTPGCFDGNGAFTDIWYVGPEDTLGNVRGSSSSDGSCREGAGGFVLTVVRAPAEGDAAARCAGLGAPWGDVFSMPIEAGYAFPVDAWGCR